MIDVEHLTKWYGRILAVDDISFHVDPGQIVGFLGPNGAGKSTTIKILTCYLPATSGAASVAGHDVLTESLEVRRRVGYMPESVPVYPEMKVREYLLFRAALRDMPRRQRKEAVGRVAERCWLSKPEDMMSRRLGELSRGYRQRVGLADVLLHNPQVLILDEPTSGLDPAQRREMRDLILDLAAEHTVMLSSHVLPEVEQTCSQIIIIAGGRIVAQGTPQELTEQASTSHRFVAEIKVEDADAAAKQVRALEGVRGVEISAAGNWRRLTLTGDGGTDPRRALSDLARDNGWPLRELHRESGSLEDYYMKITYEVSQRDQRRREAV